MIDMIDLLCCKSLSKALKKLDRSYQVSLILEMCLLGMNPDCSLIMESSTISILLDKTMAKKI